MTSEQIDIVWSFQCPPSAKLVLLALGKFADKNGCCFPSVQSLSKLTGLSPRAVRYQLEYLRLQTAVSVVCGKDQGRSSIYMVRWATIAQGGGQPLPTGSATGAYQVGKIRHPPNILELSNELIHVTMQPNPRIQEWKNRLDQEFKRKANGHWTYAELSGLTEVLARPDSDSELEELMTYRVKAAGFFPRSIERLFSSWSKTLDESRNATPSHSKNGSGSRAQGFNRNAGTAHEGTAYKYSAENRAKLKAIQASQQVPKIHP